MAKKVTIEGSNLLQNLNDDWGGVNNSQGSVTPYSGQGASTPVPAGAEWGMNRGEVERFIKEQIGGKVGSFLWSDNPDDNSFYHLLGFATKADAELYSEDPDGHTSLVVVDITLPISTVQGDNYAAYLYTNVDTTKDIVTDKKQLSIPLRFHAVKNSNGERINTYDRGTLQIERSLDNGVTWSRVGNLVNVMPSNDYSVTNSYTTISLDEYLQPNYKQLLRIRATYRYEGDDNQLHTVNSSWVSVYASVTYTTLSLECTLDWQNALKASSISASGFPISYNVYGIVDKTIHVSISGANGNVTATYQSPSTESGRGFSTSILDQNGGIFTHGVHKVEAWITASDGDGGTLESEHVVNSFMVINTSASAAQRAKQFILIQNLKTDITNFVQTTICDFAVFKPNAAGTDSVADDVNVTFMLTDYDASFVPTGNTTKYFEINETVPTNTKQHLTTSIEIESEDDLINTCFRVWRDDSTVDFLLESEQRSFVEIHVDNSENFSPTVGATFILNPKIRNNTEQNPQRILNAARNNALVASHWNDKFDMLNDGWVTDDDGVKVLRVLAGQKLTIDLSPFAQFISYNSSSLTMEFDLAIRNVSNEDDPVLTILETDGNGANPKGLTIRPMDGNMFIKGNTVDADTNFRFCEDKRTHITINIHNAVDTNINNDGLPNVGTTVTSDLLPLVRVFINGCIEREMIFDTTTPDVFCYDGTAGIVIGQEGTEGRDSAADIDIYGIRIYAEKRLDSNDVVKDYISTLPTAAEKINARTQNEIVTNNQVDIEKVKALGKRVLILHGAEPYYHLAKATVWWEIFQYDSEGNLNPDLSGTICKETGMPAKRQGTTASTYFYSNIQTKIDDTIEVNGIDTTRWILVDRSNIHSSITVSQPYTADYEDPDTGEITPNATVVDIMGGNLGKNEPVVSQMRTKQYLVVNGQIRVPDGWIDGNGKYRGMGFMITEGTPLATKLVLKVNYASSMQSHLCGGTRLYSDLHTAVVGMNALQRAAMVGTKTTARVAKYTEPVYFFTQEGNGTPVYRGGGNFGAGKMDKPTWGYVKSLYPMFMMIEGADNNFNLTDMRVPYVTDPNCPECITYDPDHESFEYGENTYQLDFDAGATDSNGYPKTELVNKLADTWNFLFLHSTMVRYFVGTYEQFLSNDVPKEAQYKYWCTRGSEAFKLKRFNYMTNSWVDAGLWNPSNHTYGVVNITTDAMTASTYANSPNQTDYEKLNKEIIGAIAMHAKEHIGEHFVVDSLKFHYVFQNHFMAGTDNCSKNTYFVCVPTSGTFGSWGDWKFELHQDDVDTIFVTDNEGHSTKPYYIDRMHPYDDKDTEHLKCCYMGMHNVLFNLCEEMWEASGELGSFLNRVFSAATNLVTAEDMAGDTNKKSLMGCLDKYFFSIQRDFFSQTAFNEQARIRYEWPARAGFVAGGTGARPVYPITQSMGSQLEAETQYMIRRVVYMASYAHWAEFEDMGENYKTGIAGSATAFSFEAYSPSGNVSYVFNLTPHQYIYPSGTVGDSRVNPHVRVAPGETYEFTLVTGLASSDTGCGLCGINYYRSIGNLADMSINPTKTAVIQGKRLVEVIAEPEQGHTTTSGGETYAKFHPAQLNISADCKLIKTISLKSSGTHGVFDVRNLNRLVSIDLRGTYISSVNLPPSKMLTTVRMPSHLYTLTLANLPNLIEFTLEGADTLQVLEIGENINYSVYSILQVCVAANAPLNRLTVSGVNWTNVGVDVLNYMAQIPQCQVTGTVTIQEPLSGSNINYASKLALVQKFGNIDSPTNPLHIVYNVIQTTSIRFAGDWYLHWTGNHQYTGSPSNEACNDVTGVEWTISTNAYGITIDQNGLLVAPALAPSSAYATVTFTYHRLNAEDIVVTRNVGIFNRPAAVGDYVYYDGTYLDFYDNTKTVVGICFYINPELPSDRRMLSMKNMVIDGSGRQDCIGLQMSGIVLASGIDAYNMGLPNETNTSPTINATNMLDENEPDGFKRYEFPHPWGDIVPMTAINDFEDVHTGDVVPRGKYFTHLMIEHRNTVLTDTNINLTLPVGTAQKKEYAHLEELIAAVIAANDNSDSYRQFYYPAASRCYAYEPDVRFNETLADKFKAHKWWLPSAGEMVRMFYHSQVDRLPNISEAITNGLFTAVAPDGYMGFWTSSKINGQSRIFHLRGSALYNDANSNYGGKNHMIRPVAQF